MRALAVLRTRWQTAALLLLATIVSGCAAAPDLVGLAAGGTAGALTANPYVGYGVAVGTRAATDASLNYIMRTRQGTEQEAIIHEVGLMQVGETRAWKVEHSIPIGNAEGRMQVTRLINNPIAPCKEVAFTVVDKKTKSFFLTTACQANGQWHWAQAEPAVPRWGFLQ
ncbi:hypothetical protein SAMN07250955_101228 [Arboricoccus pini]|uniref:Lipoprotein n=1 Tax=Arboricoccus pini TaxID=1963835 RepID=A0A212PYY8_9PROT|nr:hypothetical protein [Arboricoccus pini]SNB52315.1 hypothetical protein SAMN07250955_101228 [Arboricoccus pini]